MSLATETSTAEEKTVYSVCGLLQFSKHYAGQLIVSVLFLLLAFGQKLFSNTFSIDTQGIIQNEDSLYKSWFELERFGLVVFKKLSGTYQFNNALASFTMVVFFGISAVIWSYLLCGSTTKAKLQPAFFMIPYVASPIFAEMLGFLLLGPEISVASFLVALSLMLWSNANRPKKLSALLIVTSIVCATLSFTMYLAMVTFFITGTAILYVLRYSDSKYQNHDKNESRVFLIGSVIIFVISYALYKLLNALAMKVKGVTTNAYISDQSRWGKDSSSVILHNIGSHVLALYSGEGIFYSVIFSICALCVFVTAIYHVITKKNIALLLPRSTPHCAVSHDHVIRTGRDSLSSYGNDISAGLLVHHNGFILRYRFQYTKKRAVHTCRSRHNCCLDSDYRYWMESGIDNEQNLLHRKCCLQPRCAYRTSNKVPYR